MTDWSMVIAWVAFVLVMLAWLGPGFVIPLITAIFRAFRKRTWPGFELFGLGWTSFWVLVGTGVSMVDPNVRRQWSQPVLPDDVYWNASYQPLIGAGLLAAVLSIQGLWAALLTAAVRQPSASRSMSLPTAVVAAILCVLGSAMVLAWPSSYKFDLVPPGGLGLLFGLAMPLAALTGARAPRERVFPALIGLPAASWAAMLIPHSWVWATVMGLGLLVVTVALTAWPGALHRHVWAWTLSTALFIAPTTLAAGQWRAFVYKQQLISLTQSRVDALEDKLEGELPLCGPQGDHLPEVTARQAVLVRNYETWIDGTAYRSEADAVEHLGRLDRKQHGDMFDHPHELRAVAGNGLVERAPVLFAWSRRRRWASVSALLSTQGSYVVLACRHGETLRAKPTFALTGDIYVPRFEGVLIVADRGSVVQRYGGDPCVARDDDALAACIETAGFPNPDPNLVVIPVGEPMATSVLHRLVAFSRPPGESVPELFLDLRWQGPKP